MAEGNFEERGLTGDRLKNCLSVLNDRRVHILEPSYSLQRLVNARRKRWSEMKKYQFLDLASVNGKKLWELRPPDREYRVSIRFKVAKILKGSLDSILSPSRQGVVNI